MEKISKKAQLKIRALENHRFSVPQSSKGQFKIQETAFMLLALIIFFILAGLFFFIVMYRGMFAQANILEKEKAISTVIGLANTPEFSCTGSGACVDTDKLIVMKNRKAYEEMWQFTKIAVMKVGDEERIECTTDNYPNCNYYKVFERKVENFAGVETFVALCRKEKVNDYVFDKCEMGKILVEFEKKSSE